MAHFAQIDDSNNVLRVIVVADSDASNEAAGIAFCKSLVGSDTNWVETKKDGSIRTRFAGPGFTYDSSRDAFIPPKPYASWVINESTKDWEAPASKPGDYENTIDGPNYIWNESTTAWESI
jgi:hypothetical protein